MLILLSQVYLQVVDSDIDEIALIGNTIGSLKTNIRGHSKKIDFENFLSYLSTILK